MSAGPGPPLDEGDVWGTRAESLPPNPVTKELLALYLESDHVADVRIPAEGSVFDDDPTGPIIPAPEGGISQFLVELRDTDDYVEYHFGYPEPAPEADIHVPKDRDRARREGFIAWWHDRVEVGEVDELLASFDEGRDSLSGYYEDVTRSLRAELESGR